MFDVNSPDLDWLTVTTFNPIIAQKVKFYGETLPRPCKTLDKKWLQYEGKLHGNRDGSLFVGSGVQKGTVHHAAYASGQSSGKLWHYLRPQIAQGLVRVTRIDLQLTVDYPRETWAQSALFSALREATPAIVTGYAESASGPAGTMLATVYYLARSGPRFFRIYEKPGMADEVFLRLEAEYKSDNARAVVMGLLKGASPGDILRAELAERIPDAYGLHGLFLPPLTDNDAYPVRTIKPAGNTERWLLETCLPSLIRILNDHDANHEQIADAYAKALANYFGNHKPLLLD